jgi:putative effector of murein hydrolase LrgA (UPF0299 family)
LLSLGASKVLMSCKKNFIHIKFKKAYLIWIIALSVLAFCILLLIFDRLALKLAAYSQVDNYGDLIKFMILISIPMYVTINRYKMFISMLPLMFLIVVIGGARLNMVGFTIAIYYILREGRINHPLIYLLMIYFSIKSIFFIEMVLATGQGFEI